MKAIVFTTHGAPDVLSLRDVDVPAPKENQVLLRVRAVSLNPLDWHMVRGEPGLMKMMARGEHIRMLDILASMAGNLIAPFKRQKMYFCMAKGRKHDLVHISELVDSGQVTPVIDRTYPLAETADAMRYLETGRVRGKVVITP